MLRLVLLFQVVPNQDQLFLILLVAVCVIGSPHGS